MQSPSERESSYRNVLSLRRGKWQEERGFRVVLVSLWKLGSLEKRPQRFFPRDKPGKSVDWWQSSCKAKAGKSFEAPNQRREETSFGLLIGDGRGL